MDCELGTILVLFNTLYEVLSGEKKLGSCVCYLKRTYGNNQKEMRQASEIFWCGNSARKTHLKLEDTPNNRTKHCLIKLRTL
jgi:hypothetical protein